MGYSLTFGNAIPRYPIPGDDPTFGWDVEAAPTDLPEAPRAPNDMNPGSPFRWPSYTVWHTFAKLAGPEVYALFYSTPEGRHSYEADLMPDHPAVAAIREEHAAIFARAVIDFRARHPDAVPRFSSDIMGHSGDATVYDAALARLEWLAFWSRWVLDNCEHPALENT